MAWDPTTHYQDTAVAEKYDKERFSSIPGIVFNSLERRALRKAFASIDRTQVVLDLPCGTGRLAEALLDDGFQVVGIDISAPMLAVAGRRLQRFGAKFRSRVGDVRELAAGERNAYDVALCARVLMHFPLEQQVEFLKGVAALARGTIVFSQSISTPYQRTRRRVKALLGHQTPAHYPITERELKALLQGANLREVKRFRVARAVSEGMFVVAEHA
jgi:2-polyprenyl-3-methyl-5-hydroxy-6-metoxy-1,4-benzoquinol methylase